MLVRARYWMMTEVTSASIMILYSLGSANSHIKDEDYNIRFISDSFNACRIKANGRCQLHQKLEAKACS